MPTKYENTKHCIWLPFLNFGRAMFKKLAKKFLGGGPAPPRDGFFLKVRCDACGEEFNLFVNKSTELCQNFDEDGNVTYFLNKEIIGGTCKNRIQVTMEFDGGKNFLSKKIENGEFLEDQ